jgi:PmbA protein
MNGADEGSAKYLDLLSDLVAKAQKAGADTADAVLFQSTSLEVSWRLGKPEDLERSEGQDLGLRVFVGKRQAVVSSTDFDPRTLDEIVERGVAMARLAPEDPYSGLADPDLLCRDIVDLDLADTAEPTPEQLYEQTAAAEAAALAVDGVTNSEGAGAGYGRTSVALVTSSGFAGSYAATSHSIHASVLAGEGTAMERDYEFTSTRHAADLDDPATIGRIAGERAVRRINPRKVASGQLPVVYDPRVSRTLIGHFAGAISGQSVARGTSFLKDRMGEQVFAAGIEIVDEPHRRRGLASKPFDGEGVRNDMLTLVEDGHLRTWLLDSSSARQLGLTTNGRAARGTGGQPSPSTTNLYMRPGAVDPDALIGTIDNGIYVNELIGMGVNGVTGDYSRGASGFWIENGKLAYPVSELTIAGNLRDMFANLTPANDLQFRYGSNAPTVRIDGMMVAGT